MKRRFYKGFLIMSLFALLKSNAAGQDAFTRVQGGIVRGDTNKKQIALVFTADEFAEGAEFIRKALSDKKVHASFFFTGRFMNQHADDIRKLSDEGNYIGSHSHAHLLYCDWEKRDSLLVTKKEFLVDLKKSYKHLRKAGIPKNDALFFLPPYEWYNDSISLWTAQYGLQLINFTPGTYSNADYTTPDMGSRYLSSDTIFSRILRYEADKRNGLNGFILLLHAGTDPARTDKFYWKLPLLLEELMARAYEFVRVDEMFSK